MSYLHPVATIPTSGARAVEPFEINGERFLAIPQLAVDIPGAPADLNGGDSDQADVLIVRPSGAYDTVARLRVPGGEDAEFFTINNHKLLAIANIRSGAGPYDYRQPQRIYQWVNGGFQTRQEIPGYAAKQWRHFRLADRDFLALAQGVNLPGHQDSSLPSRIYQWDGTAFVAFQEVDSAWGYNWHPFRISHTHYLAYADHVAPSPLLAWTGERFETVQTLVEAGGRAFADFTSAGEHYLLAACLTGPSQLMRWDGAKFVEHQQLDGSGGREFAFVRRGDKLFVIRINFIRGDRENPIAALTSQIYQWDSGRLHVVDEFDTTGATDVSVWTDGPDTVVAISNSLTADIRFAAKTDIYHFVEERS